MSRLEKIVIVFLASTLFFSENTGKAFLYSCCFLGGLEQRLEQRRSFLLLSVVSIIFDIYHHIFVGLSFFSILIVMITLKKVESILANINSWARLYYLFLIICGAELISCLFIVLLNGRLNFYDHFLIVIKSIIFC